MQADHIAVLVNNIEAMEQSLPGLCKWHEPKEQPTEGTLEQYITIVDDQSPSLLLIQAVAIGPYKKALEKRGTGLHHIGCVCANIDEELASGAAKQMLLHPISLKTYKRGTVWLCRPGTPFLIELMLDKEQNAIHHEKAILKLPASIDLPEYAREISTNLIVTKSNDSSIVFIVGGVELTIYPDVG